MVLVYCCKEIIIYGYVLETLMGLFGRWSFTCHLCNIYNDDHQLTYTCTNRSYRCISSLQISLVHKLPVYTNYRCIPFPPNDCRVRYYHSEFSTQHCLQCIFSLHRRKKAEMSFLRVGDLLLVCVVLNHDANSLLYIIKTDIFIENK